MEKNERKEIVATTLFGLENVLAEEIRQIGGKEVTIMNRAVSFSGDLAAVYKANYCLRTAIKVLVPIRKFNATSREELYSSVKKINWQEYINQDATISVDSAVNTTYFNHSKFVALVVKDAIADYFREKTGVRPSVDTVDPDLRVHIHMSNSSCTISLDTNGDSLFKRGYRLKWGIAPLNEVLAAGMIRLSEWDRVSPFIDPMCGSGTLLIEAAMLAKNIPAGYFRSKYGFMKWTNFDKELWESVKLNCDNQIVSEPNTGIIEGYDISNESCEQAIYNVREAGLDHLIIIKQSDFFDVQHNLQGGVLITNPPFDERIKTENINDFYKHIGDKLKQNFLGFSAWIISSNFQALKHFGLRPERKIVLFNGSLECKFLKFSLYEGSRKGSFEKKEME